MVYFRYIVLAMIVLLVFQAGCGSTRNNVMRDPVAQSGTGSEELWYQYGGARVAYTAVARPKQLYTGYGTVRDPALYGQAPTTIQERTSPKKRAKPKPAATAPRDPNCPPCPPTDAAANTPHTVSQQASPAFSVPAQGSTSFTLPPAISGAAGFAPPPPAAAADATGAVAPPPIPPRLPLADMPIAAPAPMAPNAPGT